MKITVKSAALALVCAMFVYLICSILIVPRYQTRAYFTVGYNHLPEGFYDQLIEEEPVNLAFEMQTILQAEDTYELAAVFAFSDIDTVRSSLSITNAGGNQYETLVITCTGSQPHQVFSIANGYLRALDVTLSFPSAEPSALSAANISEISTNKYETAPYPAEDLSPSPLPFSIFGALIAFTFSFALFSKKGTFSSVTVIVFVLMIFIFLFPFYYLIIRSISNAANMSHKEILFLPHNIHFDNYFSLFSNSSLSIASSFLTTVMKTVIGTLLTVFVSSWAGYLFTFKNLWHRKFFYTFVMATMFFHAGLMPWITNIEMLGLKNNFLGLILPGLVAPCAIMLVKNHIESIPVSIKEAAYMDGFGIWQYFLRIILPMSSPLILAIAIFYGLQNWNSFLDSLLLITDNQSLQTLSHRLYLLIVQSGINDHNAMLSVRASVMNEQLTHLIMPLSVLILLPVILVYPLVHRRFLNMRNY